MFFRSDVVLVDLGMVVACFSFSVSAFPPCLVTGFAICGFESWFFWKILVVVKVRFEVAFSCFWKTIGCSFA